MTLFGVNMKTDPLHNEKTARRRLLSIVQRGFVYALNPTGAVLPTKYVSRAYLPEGETWVHLWSGKVYEGGQTVQVDAPFEQIPAFYRKATEWASLFQKLLTV